MNKKIISITLIIIMVICNSMTVWAAESAKTDKVTEGISTTEVATREQDVTASFDVSAVAKTYLVTIEWGALDYKPKEQLTGEWVGAGYYTITNENVEWEESSAGAGSVKVTNESNVKIATMITGAVDIDFKNDYFITEANKEAAKFNFTKSESDEHTCNDWTLVNNDNKVYFGLGTLAKGETNRCAITDIGITAKIEKADSLTNDNKTLGTITVSILEYE